MVLRLRGTIPRTPDGWNVMFDMFFDRDIEEVEKQQQEEARQRLLPPGDRNRSRHGVGCRRAHVAGVNPTLAADAGRCQWLWIVQTR